MQEKERSVGLSLLKIISSFLVVACHFGYVDNVVWNYLKSGAVPCFMLMSFLLCGNKIISGDFGYCKKRIKRILVPFLFWGGGFGLVALALDEVSIRDVIWQLLLGSAEKINNPFWYLSELIIITIFLAVLFRLEVVQRNKKKVMLFIIIICFFWQYSGLNYYLFNKMNLGYNQITLGRFAEMLPYAVVGTMWYEAKEKKTVRCILLSALVWIIGVMLDEYIKGFLYGGLDLLAFSFIIVMLFKTIPNRFFPNMIAKGINQVAVWSFGIYCVHFPIGLVLKRLIGMLGFDLKYFAVPTVWLASLLFVFLFSKLPFKWTKMMVS